jgi:hypothetical protein
MTRPFTIATHGDEIEKHWWLQWTGDHFPSYETFWAARVVPVTNRVKVAGDIRFQADADLAATGFTPEDVAVAQLHYTLLIHLGRTFELLDDAQAFTVRRPHLANRPFGRDQFFESFARLSGASDVADELLARRASPGTYDPWKERHGEDARRDWRRAQPDPLGPVRAYRNRLVHGRVVPEVYVDAVRQGRRVGQLLFYPKLGKVDLYLDWRVAFAEAQKGTPEPDFDEAALIAADAWKQVVEYVETTWQAHLLPNL